MINRLIEFSLKNRFLVLLAYLLLAGWGYWALLANSHRRHSRSERKPGDRLYRLGGPKPAGSRRPDHLSADRQSCKDLPGVKTVRSSSAFGFSMINIIFEDDIDVYFARTRVSERLNLASSFLPAGVVPTLGPDATGVGQVFWYTVEGPYDPGDAALASGLVHPLSAQFRSGSCGSRQHRRIRPAIPDRRRSGETARLQHSHADRV